MSVNVNCFDVTLRRAHLYDMHKSIQLKISFTFTKCNSNSVLRLLFPPSGIHTFFVFSFREFQEHQGETVRFL